MAVAMRTTLKSTISSPTFYRPTPNNNRMLQRRTSSSWTHRVVHRLACPQIRRASRLSSMWTLMWSQRIRQRSPRQKVPAVATQADLNATARIVSRLTGLSQMHPLSRLRSERCTAVIYRDVARSIIKPVIWRHIWDGTQVNFLHYISFSCLPPSLSRSLALFWVAFRILEILLFLLFFSFCLLLI